MSKHHPLTISDLAPLARNEHIELRVMYDPTENWCIEIHLPNDESPAPVATSRGPDLGEAISEAVRLTMKRSL